MPGASDHGVGSRRSGVDAIEVDDGNFDYNDRIEVEASQKEGRDFWIRPIGGVVNQKGPHTFVIEPMVDKYMQMNRTRLELTVMVVKGDGTPISRYSDVVAPVNLLGALYWKEVVVRLNGQSFDGASTINAGYKAYIETMLSCDSIARDTHLNASFWHEDDPGHYSSMAPSPHMLTRCFLAALAVGEEVIPYDMIPDIIKPDVAAGEAEITAKEFDFLLQGVGAKERETAMREGMITYTEEQKKVRRRNLYRTWFEGKAGPVLRALQGLNEGDHVNRGFDARYHLVSGSTVFDMYSPITHDFFKLNNHVGPGNRIEVIFTPYPDNFLLNTYLGGVGGVNYKIHLVDMKMHLRSIERKQRIAPPLKERYQMNQTEMHKHLVAENTPNITFRIHTGGVMPKTIIVAMVSQRAADGQYDRNPLNLHHYFIKRIALVVNGETTPADGLNFDFEQENALISKGYYWLYENTGALEGERGNLITWSSFKGGAFMVPFDMTPDKCNGLHNHEPDYGYIDLQLEFALPLNEPIYVLYEKVFNRVVINDKLNNAVTFLDVES